jgi:phosphotransferase system enzyme I (PtsI)
METDMEFKGQPTCGKIVIGKIFIGKNGQETAHSAYPEASETDSSAELLRWQTAKERLDTQLSHLSEKTATSIGASEAAVFDAHRLMLSDPEFTESVTVLIKGKKVTAETAVSLTCAEWKQKFQASNSPYFSSRAEDLADIGSQLEELLSQTVPSIRMPEEPVIFVAQSLTPSELLRLDKSRILGLVIQNGSPLSHTAILANALQIPALFGVDFHADMHGKTGILDGSMGIFITEPSDETLETYRKNIMQTEQKEKSPSRTDGQQIPTTGIRVYANLNHISELSAVLAAGADGIGLFRTEFLYLASGDFPSEEEQFQTYRAACEAMGDKKVIIRTMDIGADKQADYFHLDHEENPALGYRGIRISLDRRDILVTQLRAILRAAYYGNIAVMFPMIISVSEVKELKSIVALVKKELAEEGIPYADTKLGIMIETPAAVMISDELAKEVDFFSIGTNDLMQYTLAVDRQNPKLGALYDAHHPAILKMIEMTVHNAHKNGCEVGICGELAADFSLTEMFLKMNMDELSVSPSMLSDLRNHIRSLRISS